MDYKTYGRHYIDGSAKFAYSEDRNPRERSRHIFVFENMLLVCKKKETLMLELRLAYRLKDYILEESISERRSPLSLMKLPNRFAKKISILGDNSLKLVKRSDKSGQKTSFVITLNSSKERESWRSILKEIL